MTNPTSNIKYIVEYNATLAKSFRRIIFPGKISTLSFKKVNRNATTIVPTVNKTKALNIAYRNCFVIIHNAKLSANNIGTGKNVHFELILKP